MRLELKVFRFKQGLSQADLANVTGVSVSTYNLIENGKRRGSEDFWLRLKHEFNLTGEDIFNMQHGKLTFNEK
jgi:DNA-binding XRE family transcriptional regulator